MADDLRLDIDRDLAGRLRVAAAAAGRPVGDYAQDLIRDALEPDWAEDDARFAEYERTGVSVPANDALAGFRQSLKRRFADGA